MTNIVPIDETNTDIANTDFQVVRQNIQELINIGNVALVEVVRLADQAQTPRMYEVLSQLLKTQLEANEKLMNNHKSIRAIKKDEPITKSVTHNKNLIIASSADVLKMIEDHVKKEKAIDVEVKEIAAE